MLSANSHVSAAMAGNTSSIHLVLRTSRRPKDQPGHVSAVLCQYTRQLRSPFVRPETQHATATYVLASKASCPTCIVHASAVAFEFDNSNYASCIMMNYVSVPCVYRYVEEQAIGNRQTVTQSRLYTTYNVGVWSTCKVNMQLIACNTFQFFVS